MQTTEFDPVLEELRVRAHLDPLIPTANYLANPENFEPHENDLLNTAMGLGILIGIAATLQAAQGNGELDYSALMPDSTKDFE